MTEHRGFHRLPSGAWRNQGPAPVGRPWKSVRAPLRRRPKSGIPDTIRRPELHHLTGHSPLP